MKIYWDLVVILNFLVDFLLILGTNRITGYGTNSKRAVLAALLGAAHAAGCLLPGFHFLRSTLWRLVSIALMSAIAFGWDPSALRRGVLLFFFIMVLGGISIGFGKGGFWAVVLAALVVCLLGILGFGGGRGQRQYLPITIFHRGHRVKLIALVDTGNTLRDPVSGIPVLVVDSDAAEKLLQLSTSELQHPVETLASEKYPGLRLIPYSAVGQPSGLLLGLRVEELLVDGKRTDMIVAFAPQRIGQGRAFQALAGGMVA
jgi:stage II sporulation protein GA (sporulation sigma-E factor processing peptidase)